MEASKIPIACDKCGKKFGVDAALVGRAVKCPCGNVLKVVVPKGKTPVAATAATNSGAKTSGASPAAAVKPKTSSAPASTQAATAKPAVRPQAAPVAAVAPVMHSNLMDQLTEADFNRKAVNPYSPPASTSTSDAVALRRFGAVDDDKKSSAKTASGNITFLAVLNFIGATGYIIAGVLLIALTSILSTMSQVLPVAAIGALAGGVLFLFGIFDLVSGIGLIQRTKWGWWLCVIGLSWAIFDRAFGVAVRFMYAQDATAEIPKAIGAGVFMMSSAYFLTFMCQKSTMKMFNLNLHPGMVWGISLALGLLLGGLGFGMAIYGMQQAAAS